MKQQQISKQSGIHFRFNLDDVTFACLSACQQVYRNHSNSFSNSVIVRRALRLYLEHLEKMDGGRMGNEVIEVKRAAKGVV